MTELNREGKKEDRRTDRHPWSCPSASYTHKREGSISPVNGPFHRHTRTPTTSIHMVITLSKGSSSKGANVFSWSMPKDRDFPSSSLTLSLDPGIFSNPRIDFEIIWWRKLKKNRMTRVIIVLKGSESDMLALICSLSKSFVFYMVDIM